MISGIGWQGGFISSEIQGPKDEQELREERERLEREEQEALEARERDEIEAELAELDGEYWALRIAYQGAPETRPESEAPALARQVSGVPNRVRAYRFNECYFTGGSELPFGPGDVTKRIEANGASQQCHGTYEEHNGTYSLVWALAVHGVFHYKWGHYVWLHEPPTCTPPWGPHKPLQLACDGPSLDIPATAHIDVLDRARWNPGEFSPLHPYVCGEIDGVMSIRPPPSENGERVLHETMHFYKEQREGYELPCDWNHLRGH